MQKSWQVVSIVSPTCKAALCICKDLCQHCRSEIWSSAKCLQALSPAPRLYTVSHGKCSACTCSNKVHYQDLLPHHMPKHLYNFGKLWLYAFAFSVADSVRLQVFAQHRCYGEGLVLNVIMGHASSAAFRRFSRGAQLHAVSCIVLTRMRCQTSFATCHDKSCWHFRV